MIIFETILQKGGGKMEAQDKKRYAIDMYNRGYMSVPKIAGLVGVTENTVFRWLRCVPKEELKIRCEKRFGKAIVPPRFKKQREIKAHAEGYTPKCRKRKLTTSPLQLLDDVGVSLGEDYLGHYLFDFETDEKLYLNTLEFEAFISNPVATLKKLSKRIAALNIEKKEGGNTDGEFT